jgi:hypothetical protein
MRYLILLSFLTGLLSGCAVHSVYEGSGYIPPPPHSYYSVQPTRWSTYTIGY